MQRYEGTKRLRAKPMTRGEYVAYRGWQMPENEDAADAGYLVEYEDGGAANDSRHTGYISWSPAGVFERTYKPIAERQLPVLDTDKLGQTIRALGIAQPTDATDAAVEQQLQALGKTAPRITPIDVEANILEEHYCTAYEAAEVAQFHKAMSGTGPMDPPEPHPSLKLFTICTLVLKNGFVVTGDSACASPENFDAGVGQRLARIKAIDKVWPLMGYELRSKLAAEAAQPVSAGLTD